MLHSLALRASFFILSVIRVTTAALLSLPFSPSPPIILPQEPEQVDVLRISTDLIVFPVRVRDRNRRSILNLGAEDFDFTDKDGVTADRYFAAGTGRIALVFALDESGSLRDIISQQREAAISLFSHFQENSRVAALRFAEHPKLIAAWDTDADAVRNAFVFPARRDQRTAIFDAAEAAVRVFSRLPFDVGERRIVVLISDGLDNASHIKPATVLEAAERANVSFYVIHLPLFTPVDGRLAVRSPAKGFRELGEKSGGKYFLAGDVRTALTGQGSIDLSPLFRAIEEDLRSQYLIGFYLNDQARDGRSHRVSISIKPKGFTYATRKGRFARTHDFPVAPTNTSRRSVP
jgi:Ca-activated chloride channel family protein